MKTVIGENVTNVETRTAAAPGGSARRGAGFLFAMAGLCVVIGLVTTYGGDANLMIYSVRGLMFVIIGLVFAVIGSAALVVGAVRDRT